MNTEAAAPATADAAPDCAPEAVLDDATEKLETCACGQIADYHAIRRIPVECPCGASDLAAPSTSNASEVLSCAA